MRRKICVVTGDQKWFVALNRVFEAEGFELNWVRPSPAAILKTVIKKASPDAILWDFAASARVAIKNGPDLLRRVLDTPRMAYLPCLTFYSDAAQARRSEASLSGVDECLPKKIRVAEIVLKVKNQWQRLKRFHGILKLGGVTLDPLKREVFLNHKVNRSLVLAPKKFEFLYILCLLPEMTADETYLQRALKLPPGSDIARQLGFRIKRQLPRSFSRYLHLDRIVGKGWKLSIVA